jgi:hypothetical protein
MSDPTRPSPHSDDQHEWGMVMPFVVCQSKGGPYDDDSFVAVRSTDETPEWSDVIVSKPSPYAGDVTR